MRELDLLKETVPVPADFLTTVTINTFRPQYYFEKKQSVIQAVEVHKRYREDPEKYLEYSKKVLPLMLDSHKILCAVNIFDLIPDSNADVIDILSQTRTDHIPDFWLTILEYHRELGLRKRNLGSRGRKLVWKFLKHIAAKRGLRTVAFWFMKDKAKWNRVAYRAHAKFKGDMELIARYVLFGRKTDLSRIEDEETRTFMEDLEKIKSKSADKTLTLEDLKESNLPFRMIEGYASRIIDTTSLSFYSVAFDKMTYHEVLRRTGAMLRNGFLDRYHDLWLEKMKRGARVIDPVEIGSVILQHPELSADLREPLAISLEHTQLKFPKDCVVLCDASRSMKLKKTNARVRVVWELIGLLAAYQGIPAYFIRDRAERVKETSSLREITREFGSYEAYNPTSLSRGLDEAWKHHPKLVFLVTDGQSNIPYRGHEKLVAERMRCTIITLNPTVNPLEPEAATRIGVSNEVFLPLRDLRFLSNVLKVIT